MAGFHHLGQIVPDYDAALACYRDVLDATLLGEETLDGRVRLAFLDLGGTQVHLIARESAAGSALDDLLDTLLAHSPYHAAYSVADIGTAMDRARAAGLDLLTDEPEDGLGPYRRAFVHPSAPGIPFEFVEPV